MKSFTTLFTFINRDGLLAMEKRLAPLNYNILILENGVYAHSGLPEREMLYGPYDIRNSKPAKSRSKKTILLRRR